MRPTVLVVDDKASMLALLTKVLAKSARVVTARSERTALELLEKEPVTGVLCDLRMDDGDGLAIFRTVRVHRHGVPPSFAERTSPRGAARKLSVAGRPRQRREGRLAPAPQ